jgi:exopolysaccharide production protein ExoZ
MVVHCHFSEIVLDNFRSRWGGMGVDLFFVISGFVLYLSTRDSTTWKQYLINRVSRVVPTYWIMTSLLVFIVIFLPNAIRTAQFTVPHFLLSLAFFPHWEPGSSTRIFPIYAIGWTLMYEWYFYISFMLFMSIKKHLLLKFFVFLLTVIVGANLILKFNHDFALVTFFSFPIILEFFLGVVIAHLYIEKKVSLGLPAQVLLALSAVLLFVFMLGYHKQFGRVVCAGIPAAILVFSLVGMDARGKIREVRLFSLVGDASYSLYLIHPFVYGAIRLAYNKKYFENVPLFIVYFFSLFLVITVAVVFYRFVEVPLCASLKTALKRSFEKQPVC